MNTSHSKAALNTSALVMVYYFRIDVPMLNDRHDESLVILRRRFCWSYPDIFYSKQVVTGSAHRSTVDANLTAKLLTEERNLGDQLLYEKMREKWLRSPELNANNFSVKNLEVFD